MSTLIIDVADLDAVKASLQAAFRGEPQGCRFTFPSEEALLAMLTPNRWSIVKALTGAGPLPPSELAQRVGRDLDGVQADAEALIKCGLIDRLADNAVHLPYDEVRVSLVCKAAA
jgi:predicted transcriptional regulator